MSAPANGAALLSPAERERYAEGGTWHELFDPSDLANRAPVVAWVLVLVLLGLIAFPYLWLALRGLPDRGWSIARPVGLLLLVWPVWWLASLGIAEFARVALAATAAALAVGSVAIVVRHRRDLRAWLREHRRTLLVSEGVFWLLFASVLAVRWSNPDLWHPSLGGEKPMDLAYLNAVVKSPEFPPHDPWFAGGYINYYYYGFVLVGGLVELTAIVPHVAYNLAIPTLAASLGAASFGAAVALVAPSGRASARALASGALAAAFVTVVGNLAEVKVALESLERQIPVEWWYWNASRAISAPEGELAPITEFPAFTYLYADLHAHTIALPFTAVAVVVGLGLLRSEGNARLWGRVGCLALLALVLGALWPTNTWDFPTYALVALVLLCAAAAVRLRRPVAVGVAVVLWLALVAGAYLLYLPFHLDYRSSFQGFERWRGSRTSLADYLTVHGLFLFAIVSALVLDLARGRGLPGPARLVRLVLARWRSVPRAVRLHRLLVRPTPLYRLSLLAAAAGVGAAVVAVTAGEAVTGLVIALMTLAGLLLGPRSRRPGEGALLWQVTLLLVVIGLAITIAVEYLVVSAIDIGRTNTVFKSYLQVWLLWGIAAAVSAHRVYGTLPAVRARWRAAWRGAFVVLLACGLLYPTLATPAKIRDRFDPSVGRTLDGAAFMERARYADRDVELVLAHDLAAIRWLQTEVAGTPVVAEVNTHPKLYGWGNRFAMFTGNPAVIGWDFHQRQQRPGAAEAISARIEDVQALYRTTDPARAYRLLARYGVELVVVGGLENAYFPEGRAKWAEGTGRFWEVAYRNRATTVFRVLRSRRAPTRTRATGRRRRSQRGRRRSPASPRGRARARADGRRPRTVPRLRGRPA